LARLSIVMPVYNEARTILDVIARVRAVPVEKELIIVDDFSTDGTREKLSALASEPGIRLIFHERNQGKGAAVRTGIKHCTADIIIIQDADLEYFPEEYPELIEPIEKGWADVVYGSRFLGRKHRVLYFHHYLGNRFLTFVSNLFTNLNLTDMETCYKVGKREIFQSLELKQDRFGFDPEITVKLARLKLRMFEVPVSYNGRTYLEGKKIRYRDGFTALWCIFRYSLFR